MHKDSEISILLIKFDIIIVYLDCYLKAILYS